jgi:hypothetical protein
MAIVPSKIYRTSTVAAIHPVVHFAEDLYIFLELPKNRLKNI